MRTFGIALILLLTATSFSVAQESAPDNKTNLPVTATRKLEDVRIRGYSLAGLLADLSLWYDIPIGLEVAMNSGEFGKLRMDLKKATLVEVLNEIVAEHPEYAWEIRDGVVNVFPKEGRRDPIVKQILGTDIEAFSIKEKTVTWNVVDSLLSTPELKSVINTYGLTMPGLTFSGFYFPNVGRDFKLNVSNMSVLRILNTIIKDSKTAKFWSISRDSTEHMLSIRMAACQEDSPKVMRSADFEDLEATLDLIP